MKSKQVLFIFSTILLLILSGCNHSKMDILELELSHYSTLDFSVEGGSKTIVITTNQKEWGAFSNAEWVKTNQTSRELTINIEPNTTVQKREAEVSVVAGGLLRKIPIAQAGVPTEISVSQDRIDLLQRESTTRITVITNNKEWKSETNASWIQLSHVPGDNTLVVKVEENNDPSERNAKIFLKSGDKVREIEVLQKGLIHYILPILIPEATMAEVEELEERRGNSVEHNSSYLNGGSHTYNVKSPIILDIKYTFSTKQLIGATLRTREQSMLIEPEFHQLFLKEGFELKGDNGKERAYAVRKELPNGTRYEIVANVIYDVPRQEPRIEFNFIRRQPGPMPTFERLPFGYGDLSKNTNLNTVVAWESTHGGKFSEKKSANNFYYFDVNDNTYIGRYYIFNQDGKGLANMVCFTYDISKFFYRSNQNNYIPTDEFKALLKKEGFGDPIITGDEFGRFYPHKEKKLLLGVRVSSVKEVNGGLPSVMMMFLPMQE
ncbi:BACON domain-containing protein [Porphyromonas sp. COT-108 OH1349]|uniref:BACON domain-containing protein n=1 Tax=Porphyromonas sp. COT-108 OH1349 TaxID=1537504 RepID=UPI0009DECDC2|nr:BACON domain-containing protein [Porphyromonas sp. COT-108 OH1349]